MSATYSTDVQRVTTLESSTKPSSAAPSARAEGLTELAPSLALATTSNPCRCEHCAGAGRLIHWFCDQCGTGPFKFTPVGPPGAYRTPYGSRQYTDSKGRVAGIRYWCGKNCALGEERVYILDQIERAQQRHDTNALRIFTGRLHELDQLTAVRTANNRHVHPHDPSRPNLVQPEPPESHGGPIEPDRELSDPGAADPASVELSVDGERGAGDTDGGFTGADHFVGGGQRPDLTVTDTDPIRTALDRAERAAAEDLDG